MKKKIALQKWKTQHAIYNQKCYKGIFNILENCGCSKQFPKTKPRFIVYPRKIVSEKSDKKVGGKKKCKMQDNHGLYV